MSDHQDESQRQKVEQALSAATSLRQDLLEVAETLEKHHRAALKTKAAGKVVSIAGKLSGGGPLIGICAWELFLASVTNAEIRNINLEVDDRWERLRLDFDHPEKMDGVSMEIYKEIQALSGKILTKLATELIKLYTKEKEDQAAAAKADFFSKLIGPLKEFIKFPPRKMILRLVSLGMDVRDLYKVATALYNDTPLEVVVLLRECAAILEKLTQLYKKLM